MNANISIVDDSVILPSQFREFNQKREAMNINNKSFAFLKE
jgi:hypothetical protein